MVIVRNTAIEKELNRKMKPRYLGPYVIDRRTQGGSYVLRELDGTILKRGTAAFRLLPYISRSHPDFQRIAIDDDDSDLTEETDVGSLGSESSSGESDVPKGRRSRVRTRPLLRRK
jgi:hypothetical protein